MTSDKNLETRPLGQASRGNRKKDGSPAMKVPPVASLIAYLKNGMTPDEIAKCHGCSPAGVRGALRRNGVDIRALRHWQERKADVLSHVQMRIVGAMTTGKIEGASLRDQATTFNILHNAERLERGQSTSNVSLQALLENAAEMDKQIAALESSLGLQTANPASEDTGHASSDESR